MTTEHSETAAHAPDPELVRTLLLERARAAGLTASVSDDEAIETLLAREIVVPEPSEEECRRHYERHVARYSTGTLVEASHILFAILPGMTIPPVLAQAEATLARLGADPAGFEDAAKAFSNCPSGQVGGSLGQLSEGDVVPELARHLFSATGTGILPELVRTRHGLHVVRVDRRVPGRAVPFEEIRDRVAADLAARAFDVAGRQYVMQLWRRHLGQADEMLVQ